MVTVKDVIRELEKQPQDAEVMLWQWTNEGTVVKYLSILLRPLTKNKKFYQFGFVEGFEYNQEDWHKKMEE